MSRGTTRYADARARVYVYFRIAVLFHPDMYPRYSIFEKCMSKFTRDAIRILGDTVNAISIRLPLVIQAFKITVWKY